LSDFHVGFFLREMGSVTLLPQEFTSTQERFWTRLSNRDGKGKSVD